MILAPHTQWMPPQVAKPELLPLIVIASLGGAASLLVALPVCPLYSMFLAIAFGHKGGTSGMGAGS